ncbi:hypothetical protein OLX02_04315 [Novosphingobium sp. KCTC 2891]|uniref:hypothetical protein n=1 Tax=Novosphingobium sp. KCTC 2891 TaxID=2989730 RepID=UPI00222189FE|nr:hypothetical protein [Novosphingobium sp. KCTC 2891]MCW1382039.1 hypothetical protein [Novosphingobium sp. KCTC 2891]
MNRPLALRTAARLWALLLVLTIAFQALAPSGEALAQRSGSAFSADTIEVAIAPARREVSVELPALPAAPPVLPAIVPALVAILAAVVLLRPRSTGPPLRLMPLARRLSPRAPPLT